MQDIMSFNQKETPKNIWKHYDPDKARGGDYAKAPAH